MTYTIQNDQLTATFAHTGAELRTLTDNATGQEYMWSGDPAVWNGVAPVLFPNIGMLRHNETRFDGQAYTLPKHGLVRRSDAWEKVDETAHRISFKLTASEETRAHYPFEFTLLLTYRLDGRKLHVIHEVQNHGDAPLPYSLGGHPAFRCPLRPGEAYTDYYLQWPQAETAATLRLSAEGLITDETRPVLDHTDRLPLRHELFADDALIFTNLQSRQVALCHRERGEVLRLEHADFPYLGIWAKTNGDYVCLEPWIGMADRTDSDGEFADKQGVRQVEPGAARVEGYTVVVA